MKLLVIVPYRDRAYHLKEFIPHITKTLYSQKINSKIVVIEQSSKRLFNRGLLCNIGFSLFKDFCDYVIFHDVDLICPDINYTYENSPTSLISHRTKTGKVFDRCFGGVTLLPKKDFLTVNGFSNEYWGWGAEDDDLLLRCEIHNLKILRKNGFCNDLELVKCDTNRANNPNYKNNLQQLKNRKKSQNNDWIKTDGLSTVNLYFSIKSIEKHQDYTFVKLLI
jgi:beta-1,4-galactosyltransferase 4